jgi:dTDP-4-dehydrorhamnose 3,5-epimerase
MDLLFEISQPVRDDDSILRIDGKGARMQLDLHSLAIPDVKLIRTPRFSDARGYFCETFQRADFAAEGIENDFLQDNQSSSDRPGTIRGLHFQRPPFAQTKLVRVLRGSIFDVAVDLRRSSPSFGRHIAIELSTEGNEQLFIPAGFAHGFCTLELDTVVFYKVDQVYNFAAPVAITARTTYVASYHTNGDYSADPNLFATALTNGPLTAPASSSSGGNGVYAYGSSSLFPTSSFNSTSYGVDVLFKAQLAA